MSRFLRLGAAVRMLVFQSSVFWSEILYLGLQLCNSELTDSCWKFSLLLKLNIGMLSCRIRSFSWRFSSNASNFSFTDRKRMFSFRSSSIWREVLSLIRFFKSNLVFLLNKNAVSCLPTWNFWKTIYFRTVSKIKLQKSSYFILWSSKEFDGFRTKTVFVPKTKLYENRFFPCVFSRRIQWVKEKSQDKNYVFYWILAFNNSVFLSLFLSRSLF